MPESVLLFSGGLDSLIYWRLLGQPPTLYVPLGHKYEDRERASIARLESRCPELSVTMGPRVRIGQYEEPDGFIPYRNLVLAVMAATPDTDRIYIGAVKGEVSRDKSRKFLRDLSRLLTYVRGRPVSVLAPFQHLTKAQLVAKYLDFWPPDLLYETVSCYDAGGFCGRCQSCFRRWIAMSANGLHEEYKAPLDRYDVPKPQELVYRFLRLPVREWLDVFVNNWQAWRIVRRG
jgi:7-cyano-7-deazaguanine synthase in queuosine biosynthesis